MHQFRLQMQQRHHSGGHKKKRSADLNLLPNSRMARRRERRALQVLEELALTEEQEARFRRDLTEAKRHAQENAAKLDEENAGESHHRMLDAVHDDVGHGDQHGDDDHHVTEVEVEYIQEKLVNNFRPVQPLNGRVVYRSFKLREKDGKHHHDHHEQEDEVELEVLREKLRFYQSQSAATSTVVSLATMLLSCLLALFL